MTMYKIIITYEYECEIRTMSKESRTLKALEEWLEEFMKQPYSPNTAFHGFEYFKKVNGNYIKHVPRT